MFKNRIFVVCLFSLALGLAGCGKPPVPSVSLESLVLSEGTLIPAFDPAITEYTLTLGLLPDLHLTATAAQDGSTITVNGNPAVSGTQYGPITLASGFNTLAVTVQKGTASRTYTITVNHRNVISAVYNTNNTEALAVKSLVEAGNHGFEVVPVKVDDVPTTGFGSSCLIIVCHETSGYSGLNFAYAMEVLDDTGLPIIGIGSGGYLCFMYIGDLCTGNETTVNSYGPVAGYGRVKIADGSLPVWNVPNDFGDTNSTVDVFPETHVIWLQCAYNLTADAIPVGQFALVTGKYVMVREKTRYFYWGYPGQFENMTVDGKKLFINTIFWMLP